jgi:hypothetical protein
MTRSLFPFVVLLVLSTCAHAQPTASIEGLITDQYGALIAGAEITAKEPAIGITRLARTDVSGQYQIVALPIGDYTLEVRAKGFQTRILQHLRIEVGRKVTQDFQLQIGDVSQVLTVTASRDLIERTTIAVGHVIDRGMVKELPLNGRYFLDLGLLVPGSVTPPQGAFSSSPMRGLGALTINTGGNREEAVNYVINGVTLNDLTFSSISFQPSLSAVQEFKIDNSTFSAEFGQSSGAVVNIATRSGVNDFHGELFEFLRNDVFDARNFFTFTESEPPPFKRNQFGGNVGGPIVKNTAFFFFSYEGLRQRQRLNTNSLVLSDAQRAATTDPVIVKLLMLIPRANLIDSSGTPRFIGSIDAPVDGDQWTIDVTYNLTKKDRLHGYYDFYSTLGSEPTRTGNTIPGFGNFVRAQRQSFTLNETHIFNPNVVNEFGFGLNRLEAATKPNAQLNPAEFGINNGINELLGLPQISVAGGNLNFGGPSPQPSGRGNTSFAFSDSLILLRGRHSLKLGGEFRQFLNNNFRHGTGAFNFPTVAAFIAGTADSFSVTLGSQSSSIAQGALGFFVQDNYKLRPNLTFELGLRYEWNMTPTERYDRFIIFDPPTVSLIRVGTNIDEVYHQNNKNFQPRVGLVWDPLKDGKTSVRAAYALSTDQPMTSVVTPTAANPPLAIPLSFTGSVRLDNAINLAGPAGLAPQSINHDFDNAYLQSWNLNVQREVFRNLALMVGYFGSKGTHLIVRRNINQPLNGIPPFKTLSPTSPILPGTPLGNITQVESAGNSSYNALWVTATQRLARGLQFDASYTWSKSLDYNSFSTGGVIGQDSYNLRADRGLSDFDARHRAVLNAIYDLPFRGNRLIEGWQFALIVQCQSGSPINIVSGNSTVNGIANTLRPDATGPINIVGQVERWFDTTAFIPVAHFGNLGRNVVIGPGFNTADASAIKNIHFSERARLQLRLEVFDLFNHANFGPPGNVVGTPAFGRLTSTRFPTGESGSSRQIQFAMKISL